MSDELRTYETICLTKVDMPDDKYSALMDKVSTVIKKSGSGDVISVDEWGRAKIAYPINKDGRARWTYIVFKSSPAGVNELNRNLKLNEFVLRANTFKSTDDGATYEKLKPNMEKELQEKDRPQQWRDDRGGYKRNSKPRRFDGGGRGERGDYGSGGGGGGYSRDRGGDSGGYKGGDSGGYNRDRNDTPAPKSSPTDNDSN